MLLKLVSVAGYLMMVASLLALLAVRGLFGDGAVAIAAQVLAVGLMVWARVTFGRRSFHLAGDPTEGGLVTSGPYRYIRHPIYAAVLCFTWSGVLSHLSVAAVAAGACGVAGAGLRIVVEERLLAARYPEYQQYASRTARVIPRVL